MQKESIFANGAKFKVSGKKFKVILMEFSSGEGIGNWNQHDEEVYRLYSGFIIMNGLYFYYLKISLKVNTHLSQDTWMCVARISVCVCVCVCVSSVVSNSL